ncbi:Aspartyl-tRNA(Asn) amidotransferase subunit C [Microcystis aeruginosa NIES-2481]|nr:Aspartyl-tRNA(Asn) amidotransferase subunit C [Microcystis aeruginosa NIES-2481]
MGVGVLGFWGFSSISPLPYTLHPTPHTLHPTPHTLHPTPYTLFQVRRQEICKRSLEKNS